MMLIDTHCHVHEADYPLSADETIKLAHDNDVDKFFCVGTSEESSGLAVEYAVAHQEAYAIIGVHPHETKDGYGLVGELAGTSDRIIGVGEIGLDYYYNNSPREVQIEALEAQIQIALDNDYPISFHVRDAFDDFWPIFNNFHGIRGVLHSFTDSMSNLERVLSAGLYVGLNGISTFAKKDEQKVIFDAVPLDRMLLETDAPFLTPAPHRGKINMPAYVRLVAEYHALRRGISLNDLAKTTTHNASVLFALD